MITLTTMAIALGKLILCYVIVGTVPAAVMVTLMVTAEDGR